MVLVRGERAQVLADATDPLVAANPPAVAQLAIEQPLRCDLVAPLAARNRKGRPPCHRLHHLDGDAEPAASDAGLDAQWIGEGLPATHFMRLVCGLMLKGAALSEVSGEFAALAAILLIISALAISRYKVTLDRMSAPGIDQSDALSRLIPSRVTRGFVVAIISGFFFTGLNASVKELAHEMPPLLVSWGRWLAGIAVILPIVLWQGGVAGLATRNIKLHVFRGLFHFGGYALWYEAVAWLPLATMAALGFTGPIFVTIGAVLFLGEKVHVRRWIAVAIGFLGMLVIVRPGLATPNPGVWMMLAAVPLMAGSNLVAKAVSSRERPAVVVFWQSVVAAICFTPFGLWFWQTPTGPQLLLFAAAGIFGTLGYFFITWSFRLLDISALQPITFLGIVWAALMDVAVWGKTSDLWTFVGAAIIVAATSYIAHREAVAGGKKT